MRADEDTVLDRHPGRDEGKGLDLDPATKHRSALYLDERGDLALGADLAAVHVHQLGVEDDDVLAQLDVGCDQDSGRPPDARVMHMCQCYGDSRRMPMDRYGLQAANRPRRGTCVTSAGTSVPAGLPLVPTSSSGAASNDPPDRL